MNESLRRVHDAFFVQIADRIGQAIIDGAYAAGSALPREADLAVKHKVGRSAIREALKMLAAKGLIESRPRRGTIVLPPRVWNMFDPDVHTWLQRTQPTPALIQELLEIRRTFEPAAAELAARRAGAEEIARIEAALERIESADRQFADPLAADIEFHTSIVDATGNRFFTALVPLISTGLMFNFRAIASRARASAMVTIVNQHRPIVAAIIAGDADTAYDSSLRLLDTVETLIAEPSSGRDSARGSGQTGERMVAPAS